MRRVTVSIDDKIGAAAEAVAKERGLSVSEFYARAVEAAVDEHKRQRALERIEQEAMGRGANVSRKEFDAAQEAMRRDEAHR